MDNQSDTKYNVVKEYLLSVISENSDKPNFRLPSESELSKKFNVSRITSQRALEILEQQQLIYRKKGSGTFIKGKTTPAVSVPNKTIALLIPDLKSRFITSIVHGIEQTLKQHGYMLFLAITDYNQKNEQEIISQFVNLGIGGFIIYPVDDQVYNEKILELILNNFPLVFVDRLLPGITANNVSSPHTHDCMQIVDTLIDFGHEKIGIISPSPQGTTTLQRRLDGYEKAMFEHEIPIEKRHIYTDWKHYAPGWEQVLSEYIDKNPDLTAIIAMESDIGYKLLTMLKRRSIRVPQDVSVVIFDDEYSEILQFMNLNPARIKQSPFEIGVNAADLILKSIKNPKRLPQSIRTPSQFLYGNTILNLKTGEIVQN